MKYFSLNHKVPQASFEEAVIRGIAPDKGLYFPKEITPLPDDFFENLEQLSNEAIAFELIKQFIGDEIPEKALKKIISKTLAFDFPIVAVDANTYALELFHGPTMAFKDVGARFMARCLAYFNRDNDNRVTVLVATSGDTGGAVANGFLGVKGVDVVILYPSGKVSEVQEKQLTTLGQNIQALEVDGSFDDCQAMIKTAFLDKEITSKMHLTSANSINVARWLPQMFYFAFAFKKLKKQNKPLVFSTPSGNFGNICAGMMAQKLGLPVAHFIAATNINRVVPDFMETGEYLPAKSFQTISNAMDVGDPSNFIRIRQLYQNDFDALKAHLSSYSFTDDQTRSAMKQLYENSGYIADPHGAVGYLGLKEFMKDNLEFTGVFLETAHPVKFLDVVEPVIGKNIDFPPQIEAVMHKTKQATPIETYEELKCFLVNR